MAICMFALGAVLATHPPVTGQATNNTPSGKGMVMILHCHHLSRKLTLLDGNHLPFRRLLFHLLGPYCLDLYWRVS